MSRLPVAAARPAPTTALPAVLQADQLPAHVAVIMDGNGRWARQRGLPRVMGHRQGSKPSSTCASAATGALAL